MKLTGRVIGLVIRTSNVKIIKKEPDSDNGLLETCFVINNFYTAGINN